MSHKRRSHITRMNESCHIYEWVMSHIWMSHVTYMNESHHTHEWVVSHIWIRYVKHMNEFCHTHEWIMSHIHTHTHEVHPPCITCCVWLIFPPNYFLFSPKQWILNSFFPPQKRVIFPTHPASRTFFWVNFACCNKSCLKSCFCWNILEEQTQFHCNIQNLHTHTNPHNTRRRRDRHT